ncbi:MAG TPA: hypothetical protein VH518_24805 [Tepidisphaeraceae bacterium]
MEDPRAAARHAGLHYVSDETCRGIHRRRRGDGFTYIRPSGARVRDPHTLGRIKSLVIPPAWEDVWICQDPRGHIQAVGRDARGRKQYRYHPKWRQIRDDSKYHKLLAFAHVLPRVCRRVRRDLGRQGLPREKVLAAVIAVMEKTLIRIGNEEYANHNDSYGLTTLHDEHARINGSKVTFEFRGKGGKEHEIDLEDSRLAHIIRRCRDLPGEELFQYLNDRGEVCHVHSTDVNEYLRRTSGGQDFTAKDFRTWAGTVLAFRALRRMQTAETKSAARKNILQAIDRVAQRLGNTRAVCRRSYIHPAIIQCYLDHSLAGRLAHPRRRRGTRTPGLRADEALVLGLLRR